MNIQEIYQYLADGNNLSVEDRQRFQITNVEQLIHMMCQSHPTLFHATRDVIPYGNLLRLNPINADHRLVKSGIESVGTRAAFAANYAVVLLIKALFSNHHDLDYVYGQINRLGLYRLDDGVVNSSGYIYLLNDTSTFQNTNYSQWEKYTTMSRATFGGAITVTLDDLPQGLKIYKQRLVSLEELRGSAEKA